jgi:Fic family protein
VSNSKLLCPPQEKAAREVANGVEQIAYIDELVSQGAREVRESHVLELHHLAVVGIYPCAGQYRDATKAVSIQGSGHKIPEPALVPSFVRDALTWINDGSDRSALERAAFCLWRFNWIHPFAGGNGRTSRALAYLVVCMDNGAVLPGIPSMPAIIYEQRDDYIRALRAVDASDAASTMDLTPMRDFLEEVLTRQLAVAIAKLAGRVS